MASGSATTSPTPTIHEKENNGDYMAQVSPLRKWVLLGAFSIAQFVDVCNIGAIFSSIPKISQDLGFSQGQSVWLPSAYQLTFASFLLLSGRLSDIYNPKLVFNLGFGGLGIISLIAGFIKQKVVLLVFRAFQGIMAALTIPSALTLIVHLFPDPIQQGFAISVFGGAGAIGNAAGLLIGATFVQLVTWHWTFFFNAIVAVPVAIACVFLIPAQHKDEPSEKDGASSFQKAMGLDIIGVSTMTLSFVLLIFAFTSGSTDGWGSAKVIAPLVISIFLLVAFFVYEAWIPTQQAALPPRIWFYPNFAVLFGCALIPYFWWTTIFFFCTSYWQTIVGWSPVLTAVHIIPNGVVAFVVMFFLLGPIHRRFKLKTILLTGGFLLIPGTILFALCDRSTRYWGFAFPGFIIGCTGCSLVFTTTNIAMFKSTPPSQAGIVGAVFNSALQLGAAVGIAAITSLQTNIDKKQANPNTWKGRAAGFWFLLGAVCLVVIGVIVFFDNSVTENHLPPEEVVEEEVSAAAAGTTVPADDITDLKRKRVPQIKIAPV